MLRSVLAPLLVLAPTALANELRVENVSFARGEQAVEVRFDLAWENAWHNERNHDGAWVFAKVRARGAPWWEHARLAAEPAASGAVVPGVELPADRDGAFVFAAERHRGAVAWRIALSLDPASFERFADATDLEIDVLALEMVRIPAGPFVLGDPDPQSLAYGSFFRHGEADAPPTLYRVESEDAIAVGDAPGSLDYRVERPEYQGDRAGPIPAAFPKGFAAFWVMKYELTQGDYARFLDHLPDDATGFRANFGGRLCARQGGTIRFDGEHYVAGAPDRPANFLSWDDGCAFLDWAGLRPLTELEFTKACRGPREPGPREYPWGTSSKERLRRVVGPDWELAREGEADEARLANDTREVLGASWYWVMDLAGSLWERVVTVGHPAGRAFTGTHGDGRLSWYGSADVPDWPRGDDVGGGYGYRGGGWYGVDHEYDPSGFNPWSPVAWRRYGAWGQGPRYVAYGMRGGRTAVP